MFYKLKSKYLLRGWEKLPTGVVDTELGFTRFLKENEYIALRFCNGVLDFDSLFFPQEVRNIAKELEQEGLVESFSEAQQPVTDEQDYFEYKNRFIRSVHWSITGRCNYNCLHCFMSAPDQKHPQMTFEDCKKIVEDMHDCGVFSVQLTGGEALIHPHFWDIVDLLLEYKIRIDAIYSNGFLINEKFFDECKKRNIRPSISLSFDGTDGWHQWLRNVPGALEHITKALDLCKENGFHSGVEFCLHEGNKHTLRESMKFLQEHGCAYTKIITLTDMGRGEQIKEKILSPMEHFKICREYIPEYKKDKLTMEIQMENIFLHGDKYYMDFDKNLNPEKLDNHVTCGHARTELCISPDGLACPCPTLMDTPIGKQMPNILEKGLKNVLNDSSYLKAITFTLGEFFKSHPECKACEHVCKCAGGCRARGTAENGEMSWTGIDKKTCDFYKNGERENIEKACIEAGFVKN